MKYYIIPIPSISENPYLDLFYNELEKHGFERVKDFRFTLRNVAFLKKQNKRFIVHFHWNPVEDKNYLEAILRIGWFFLKLYMCKIRCIKIIWTAHNLLPHEKNKIFLQYLKRFILVHMADLIIVHFEEAKNQICSKFFVSSKKIALMHHGLYKHIYENTSNLKSSREILRIPLNKVVFLIFGEIRRYKNIESLIKAFMQLDKDNTMLIIAGSDYYDEQYKKEILSLIKSDERVISHFKYINSKEVQFYFNSANCIVLPYKNIFTSGAAMLALTFKKPVLMRNCSFAREYLDKNNSILIEEVSAEQLKKGMEKFIDSRNQFDITESTLNKYRWENVVAKFLTQEATVFFNKAKAQNKIK